MISHPFLSSSWKSVIFYDYCNNNCALAFIKRRPREGDRLRVLLTNPLFSLFAFLTVSCRELTFDGQYTTTNWRTEGVVQDDLGRLHRESQFEISGTKTVRKGFCRPEFDQQQSTGKCLFIMWSRSYFCGDDEVRRFFRLRHEIIKLDSLLLFQKVVDKGFEVRRKTRSSSIKLKKS